MKPKEIAGIVIIASLFFAGVFLAREFSAQIGTYLDFGLAGMFVYVFAGIFATVAAPISTVPIIPIAAALWGPFTTAVLSVFAWTIGSIIAFLIARYFGKPIIARFADVESISKYERLLGGGYLFWNVAFLRAAVPVDILSYAIGLFTKMNIGAYTLATFIGIIAFAIVFSYSSRAPISLQILFGFLAAIVMYIGYRKINTASSRNDDESSRNIKM